MVTSVFCSAWLEYSRDKWYNFFILYLIFFYVFVWLLSVYCNSETLFYRKDIQISTESEADQTLELKIFVKQLMNHSNFIWFALMNLIQVSSYERKTSWKHEPHSKSRVFPIIGRDLEITFETGKKWRKDILNFQSCNSPLIQRTAFK